MHELNRDENNKVSLEEFIKQNEQLLSALGIFAALIVLSRSLNSSLTASLLSFVFVAGLIIIWFDVWSKLPEEKRMTFRLFLFRYVLLWSGIGLVLNWLLEFRIFWNAVLWIPIGILVAVFIIWTFLPIIRKWAFTRWLFGIDKEKKSWYNKLARGTALLIVTIVSIDTGYFLSIGTNLVLDIMKRFGY